MDALPLVSIVTPAFNQAKYLAQTIESVLAQDYPHIEYIVLDDGSTDHTTEVLQAYAGRIQSGRHPNMGQARTLNKGWAMARGSLIGYLSSDDLLESQAVSRLVRALQRHPDVGVVYGDFALIDNGGRQIRTIRAEDYDENRLTVDLVCQPGPGSLFRRELFDRTGGWNESLRQVPDFEFWLRVCRLGRFMRVPEVLAQYRVHEGSASSAAISLERSVEIVNVVTDYWRKKGGEARMRAISTANVMAAKNHFQSGRPREGYAQILDAIRSRGRSILELRLWKMVLGSLVRRGLRRFR